MKQTVQAPLAGPGRHASQLAAIETIKGQYDKPAFRWRYQVTAGPEQGKELVKTTGTELRKGTALGNLVEQSLGRELRPGEEVELDDFVGQEFEVFATPGSDGNGAIVQKIAPLPAAK